MIQPLTARRDPENAVPRTRAPRRVVLLAAGVALAVLALLWLEYRTTREWQRSAALVLERRAAERADTLVRALTDDMRGVQESVLASRHWDEISADPRDVLIDLVAVTFARYPYPESFFAWKSGAVGERLFFTRADRPPAWMATGPASAVYPVTVVENAPVAAVLAERIGEDIAERRDYSLFETTLSGIRYQVVARILYRDPLREHAESAVGFMVDLAWARREYFKELSREVVRAGEQGPGFVVTVVDEEAHEVIGTSPMGPGETRPFPLFFFHPRLVTLGTPPDLRPRIWSVHVGAADDPALTTAYAAADWTFLMTGIASTALIASLLLGLRVMRAEAALTKMRSEFVAAVTHELKTPLATIRAVGETLAGGRVSQRDTLKEYSLVLVHEAKRLTRLVDNLLAYSRVTDTADIYTFEPQGPGELIDEAIQGFRQQLADASFEVHLDIPADLPLVRADRTAMRLLLDNIIDNAILYSPDGRWLGISVKPGDKAVCIEIRDKGQGIPADELALVQRRFYRGRITRAAGSGLGLAIATRIAEDHGGSLTLESTLGVGTTVRVTVPIAG